MTSAATELAGRVAIVVRGGAFGAAIASALTARGAEIVTIENDGGSAAPCAAETVVARSLELFGRVDILVFAKGADATPIRPMPSDSMIQL